MISNIVFTKNRPLQLHAYLESLYRYFPADAIQTYIIYKVELFDEEYTRLFRKYANCTVMRETDFSSDFSRLLNSIDTKYILFGVDDVIYFDSVDFEVIDETFNQFPEDIFGFSLRFGNNVKNGEDEIGTENIAGQKVYSINWTQGRIPTTRYPFELCATIYKTHLVKKILKSSRNNNLLLEKIFAPGSPVVNILSKVFSKHSILKKFGYFYNPNTLESWNCRWCQRNWAKLPSSLFFQQICATAIQVNMVNTTTNNKDESQDNPELTVKALNEKYKQNYRIDINSVVKRKPTDTHCGKEYFKLKNTLM